MFKVDHPYEIDCCSVYVEFFTLLCQTMQKPHQLAKQVRKEHIEHVGRINDNSVNVPKINDAQKIAVSVVFGDKGVGKTSLVNHLLGEYKGEPVAVLQIGNGQKEIDQTLAAQYNKVPSNSSFLNSQSSCECCNLQGTFRDTLLAMPSRTNVAIRKLIIEVSNEAQNNIYPKSVLSMFSEQDVAQFYRIDVILSILDAIQVYSGKYRENPPVYLSECIALSDRIIVNKIDCFLETHQTVHIEHVVSIIEEINPFAKIIQTEHGLLDTRTITGVETMTLQNCATVFNELNTSPFFKRTNLSVENVEVHCTPNTNKYKRRRITISPEKVETRINENTTASVHQNKETGISYIGITCTNAVFHRHRFESFLEQLFDMNHEIYRAKGYVRFSKSLNIPSLIQSIHHRFSYDAVSTDEHNGKNIIMFIGKNLNVDWIFCNFQKTIYQDNEAEAADEQFFYQDNE